MSEKAKKILFINFGGLGDEILFLPAIISVKKEFPNSGITLALEPRSKGITSLTDIIDETLFADIKCRCKYMELLKLLFKIPFLLKDFKLFIVHLYKYFHYFLCNNIVYIIINLNCYYFVILNYYNLGYNIFYFLKLDFGSEYYLINLIIPESQ